VGPFLILAKLMVCPTSSGSTLSDWVAAWWRIYYEKWQWGDIADHQTIAASSAAVGEQSCIVPHAPSNRGRGQKVNANFEWLGKKELLGQQGRTMPTGPRATFQTGCHAAVLFSP